MAAAAKTSWEAKRNDIAIIDFGVGQGDSVATAIKAVFEKIAVVGDGNVPVYVFIENGVLREKVRAMPWQLAVNVGTEREKTRFFLKLCQ